MLSAALPKPRVGRTFGACGEARTVLHVAGNRVLVAHRLVHRHGRRGDFHHEAAVNGRSWEWDRIDGLREENEKLRRGLIELTHEKQVLEEHIARQSAYILELRRQTGRAPHDFEPARPGVEDVD